eukprot:gene28706-34654_t
MEIAKQATRHLTTMDNHKHKTPHKPEQRKSSSVLFQMIDSTCESGDVKKDVIWADEYIELHTEQPSTKRTRIFRLSCGLVSTMMQTYHKLPELWKAICSTVKHYDDRVLFSTDHIVYTPLTVDTHARPAYRIFQGNKVLDGGEYWNIEILTNVHTPFDIEIHAKLRPEYERRHYYRIKQQYIKLYFERYCLEHGQYSNKAHAKTKEDSDEEDTGLAKVRANVDSNARTLEAFSDEFWSNKKRPNYMLNAFIDELLYDKDQDRLLIRSIESLELADYLAEVQERQLENFSEVSEDSTLSDEIDEEELTLSLRSQSPSNIPTSPLQQGRLTPPRTTLMISIATVGETTELPDATSLLNLSSPPPYDKYMSYLEKAPPLPASRAQSPVQPTMRSSPSRPASRPGTRPPTRPSTRPSSACSQKSDHKGDSQLNEVRSASPTNTVVASKKRSVTIVNKEDELKKKLDVIFKENQQRIDAMYKEAQDLMAVSSQNNTMNDLGKADYNNNGPLSINLEVVFNEKKLETKVMLIKEILTVKAEYRSSYSTNMIIDLLTSDTKLGSFCSYCSPYDLKALANSLTLLEVTDYRQLEKQLPIHENDPIDNVYIVLQGRIEVYTRDALLGDSNNDDKIIQSYHVGDVLGENAFSDEDARWQYSIHTPNVEAANQSSPNSPTSPRARLYGLLGRKAVPTSDLLNKCLIRLGVLPLSVLYQFIGQQSTSIEEVMVYFWKSLRLHRHITAYNDQLLQKSFEFVRSSYDTGNQNNMEKELIATHTSFQPINLISSVRKRIYPMNTTIFEQGQSRFYMYMLKQGHASYYRIFPKDKIGEDVIPERVPLCDQNFPVSTTNIKGEKVKEAFHNDLLSGDFSFMDSEDVNILDYMDEMEYVYYQMQKSHAHRKKNIDKENGRKAMSSEDELQAVKKLEEYYKKKFHKFHHHKNTLITNTRCEVYAIPLVEIAKYMYLFQSILSLSNIKYPVLLLTNEEIVFNYYERLAWYGQKKDEILEEVAMEQLDRRTYTDYYHAIHNNENDALYNKRSAIHKKIEKVHDPFYYIWNEIENEATVIENNPLAPASPTRPHSPRSSSRPTSPRSPDKKKYTSTDTEIELSYVKALNAIMKRSAATVSDQASVASNERASVSTGEVEDAPELSRSKRAHSPRAIRPSTATSTPNRSHRKVQRPKEGNQSSDSKTAVESSVSRPKTSGSGRSKTKMVENPSSKEKEEPSGAQASSDSVTGVAQVKRRHGLLAQVQNVYDIVLKSEQLVQFQGSKGATKNQPSDADDIAPKVSARGGKTDESADSRHKQEASYRKAFISAKRKNELMQFVGKQHAQSSSPQEGGRLQQLQRGGEVDHVQAKKNDKLLSPEQYVQMYKERLHGNPREQFANEFNFQKYFYS